MTGRYAPRRLPAPRRHRCRPAMACWCAIVSGGAGSARCLRRLCAAARTHGNGVDRDHRAGQLASARVDASLRSAIRVLMLPSLDIDLDEGVPVIADPLPDDPAALDRRQYSSRGPAPGRRRSADRARAESLSGRGWRWRAPSRCAQRRHPAACGCDLERPMLACRARRRCGLGDNARSGVRPAMPSPLHRSLLAAIGARGPEARARDLLRNTGIGALRLPLTSNRRVLCPPDLVPSRSLCIFSPMAPAPSVSDLPSIMRKRMY